MSFLGLPPKLRLAPLWPALAAVLTASALLWSLLPGLLERSASVQLLDTLRILSPIVVAERQRAGLNSQAWVRSVAGGSGLRVTLVRSDGVVIADSAQTASEVTAMENHSGRPEVREALATGEGSAVRRSATTRQTYVYAARTLTDPNGRLIVLRLAQPVSQIDALHGGIATAMLFAALAAAVSILITSLWIDRRLFRPYYRLIEGAADLASGRIRRVPLPDEDELAALGSALNRLAERAEAQLGLVRDERDHLMTILASMSEGVLVVGGDGRARLVNPALRRLFDLSGDVTGRTVLELLRQPELARIVDDTLRLGAPQSGGIELQAPERRTLLLESAALAGGERGAVVVARDTTELTRVADMRRDFVANVSHELKTPLAAIRGYAETLRDGALDEPATAQRFTERILQHCRRLQALLDDLLTLSRLEGVAPSAEREPVDLHAVVQRAMELLAPAARAPGASRIAGRSSAAGPRRCRGPGAPGAQPVGQRDQIQPSRRPSDLAPRPGGRPARPPGSERHRHRHPAGVPAAHLRALLPRRQGALTRRRRHRPRPRHRQARCPGTRRPGRSREPDGEGDYVPGQAAGVGRALRG